jgi:hypothetical protein
MAAWVENDFVSQIKNSKRPAYYGRGTLMTRGAEEYHALNLNYDNTKYTIYPDYKYTLNSDSSASCTSNNNFCLNGADQDNFFTNPNLVSDTAENAWIAGLMKWMIPNTPYPYDKATTNEQSIEIRPSGHSIMVGTWEPSPGELKFGVFKGFGATTASLRGETECGKTKNVKANLRKEAYKFIAKRFGLDDDTL